MRRLRGAHCYDVFTGHARLAAMLEREPGTYLLTDFLVRSFRQTVVAQLGRDRYPELRGDYFRHYRRVVWPAQDQDPSPELSGAAREAAEFPGLPLTVISVGGSGLETELGLLI